MSNTNQSKDLLRQSREAMRRLLDASFEDHEGMHRFAEDVLPAYATEGVETAIAAIDAALASQADESAREPEGMRAAFMAWVEDQGCDTDGAWSAWQGCWGLASSYREAYLNMRQWAEENGLDTTTYFGGKGQSKEEGSFSGGAKSLERNHLVALLRAARRWVEEGGTISGYGFYRPENPHDFHPDPESCTEEEIANHRAACEAWDRGDYKREPGSIHMASDDGSTVVHITRAPWGIGSYTDMQDEAADLLAAIDCTLAEHAALSSQSEADESTREPDGMRAAFMEWAEDRGCDTDGAWSAWQACWNLLHSQSEAR